MKDNKYVVLGALYGAAVGQNSCYCDAGATEWVWSAMEALSGSLALSHLRIAMGSVYIFNACRDGIEAFRLLTHCGVRHGGNNTSNVLNKRDSFGIYDGHAADIMSV